MLRLLMTSLLRLLLVVLGTSTIVFAALFAIADPVRTMLPLGTSQERIESMRSSLGFDDPIGVQYVNFLKGAASGDFGVSTWLQEPALGAVLERLPITLTLVVGATLVGGLVGLVLGVTASLRPGSAVDRLVSIFSYAVLSIPHFWAGMMMVLLFSVNLGLVPTSGYGSPSQMLLPILTLSLVPLGHTSQLVRRTMLEEASKPYITQALAKGQSATQVAVRHQLRNVALPVTTLLLYDLAHVFVAEAVIVEVLFAWPGVGRLAVGGLERGDVFLVQAVVVVAALVIALINLVADLLYVALDPRTRKSVKRRGRA